MPLYQPANGWDASIKLAVAGDTVFSDASEMFNVGFSETHNLQRRKQLGTKSPAYMPGMYDASGNASGYFITGPMAQKLLGVADTSAASRDHAARGLIQFNLQISFASFPIQLRALPTAGVTSPPTATPSGTGGTVPAGTQSYRVSAVTATGETDVSPAGTATTSGTTSSVVVTWSAAAGATGYKVYGRTAGSELLLATLGNVTTWTDTGANTPLGALPSAINLVGYILSGCLLESYKFDIAEGTYIEQPQTFKVQRVIDVYQGDSPTTLAAYIV